jgi:hypothetical protein
MAQYIFLALENRAPSKWVIPLLNAHRWCPQTPILHIGKVSILRFENEIDDFGCIGGTTKRQKFQARQKEIYCIDKMQYTYGAYESLVPSDTYIAHWEGFHIEIGKRDW